MFDNNLCDVLMTSNKYTLMMNRTIQQQKHVKKQKEMQIMAAPTYPPHPKVNLLKLCSVLFGQIKNVKKKDEFLYLTLPL